MSRKTVHSTVNKKHLTKEEKEQKQNKEKLLLEFSDTKKNLMNKAKIPFLLNKNNALSIKIFQSLVDELYGIGIHNRSDLNNLCLYINNLFKYNQLQEIINKEGFLKIEVDEETGEIIEKVNNKTLTIQKNLIEVEKQLMKQGSILGIGASEKISLLNMILGNGEQTEEDEFENTIINPKDLNPEDFKINEEDLKTIKEVLKND